MAGEAVSISEITRIPSEANIGYGTGGVGGTDAVIPWNKAIDLIGRAGEIKAQNDQYRITQFNKIAQDKLSKFNEFSVDGVMEADYPELVKEWAALAKDQAENLNVLFNPSNNLELAGSLEQREKELRGKIAQSKQDVLFRKEKQSYLAQHPDLNTDLNREDVETFTKSKLGSRQYNGLTPPSTFNPKDFVADATLAAISKTKSESLKKVNGQQWLTSNEALKYNHEAFVEAYRQIVNTTQDKNNYGKTLREVAEGVRAKLPTELQGTSIDDWIDKTARSFIPQDSATATQRESQYGLQDDRQAADAAMQAARLAMEWKIATKKDDNKKAVIDRMKVGGLANEIATELMVKGSTAQLGALTNIFGDPSLIDVEVNQYGANPNELDISKPTILLGKTTVKTPAKVVTGSQPSKDPNYVDIFITDYTKKNRKTGEMGQVNEITVLKEKIPQLVYGIGGSDVSASEIRDAAAFWRKQKGKTEDKFNVDEMNDIFQFGTNNTPAATTPPSEKLPRPY